MQGKSSDGVMYTATVYHCDAGLEYYNNLAASATECVAVL